MNLILTALPAKSATPSRWNTQWRSVGWRLSFIAAVVLCFAGSDAFSQKVYTIGDGTSFNGATADPSPYGGYWGSTKTQMLVLASELTALGATADDITGLAFDVADLYLVGQSRSGVGPLSDFTIKIKQTTATEHTAMDGTGTFATVFSSPSYAPELGWNNHEFDNSFSWDGTSNILIETCHDNADWNNNAGVLHEATAFTSVVYRRDDDLIAPCDPSTAQTGTTSLRPNMRFTLGQPSNMDVVGTTAEQPNTTVSVGSPNAPIIRVEIETCGSLNPLSATSFNFNANGTGDLSHISNARVFFTGSDMNFNSDNQFGSVIPDINGGTLSFNGSQDLINGKNYFWLTYEVSNTAPVGAVLDGELINSTVGGGLQIPADGAPEDVVFTALEYCFPSGAINFEDTFIHTVEIGSLNNPSPPDESIFGSPYSDYTFLPPPLLARDRTHAMTVLKGSTFFEGDAWLNVFIDFNRNGVYEDSERAAVEFILEDNGNPQPIFTNISIPPDAVLGEVGMRVIIREIFQVTGPLDIIDPCSLYPYGETEDYIVSIVPAPPVLGIVGNTNFGNVGNTTVHPITFTNSSDFTALDVSNLNISGAGAGSYQLNFAGTGTPIPSAFTIPIDGQIDAELIFGELGVSNQGQQNASLNITHNGENNPIQQAITGNYSALTATEDGVDLLAPGVVFDIGGVNPGQLTSKAFSLGGTAQPLDYPIGISGFTITGPDAALFEISSLPVNIFNSTLISVAFSGQSSPGSKEATLTINHSAANGPASVIKLTGRVGTPLLGAPSFVGLPSIAVGESNATPYGNAALIRLSRDGLVDVEMTGAPTLSGSGAGAMEILKNGNNVYLRDPGGPVTEAYMANPLNWASASAANPVVVSNAQSWLLVVRLKSANNSAFPGQYNADLFISDGSGAGITNAENVVSVTVIGEIINDPSQLELSPSFLTYGITPVGSMSVRTITLRNQSNVAGTATLGITGQAYWFSNGSKNLNVQLPADNSPVNVQVEFAPLSAGTAIGAITAGGVLGGSVALSGTGLAGSAGSLTLLVDGVEISDDRVDFGNVAIGQTPAKTITIVNNNIGPVNISNIARSGSNATQFTVGPVMPDMTIPGNGGSRSFDVRFVPTSTSSPQKNALITIFNNTGAPLFFNVRGTAVTDAEALGMVEITPASWDFGGSNGSHTFTVNNNRNTNVTLQGAVILQGITTNFSVQSGGSGVTLPANGGSSEIVVDFNASSGTTGLRQASLLVLYSIVGQNGLHSATASLRGSVGQSGKQSGEALKGVTPEDAQLTLLGVFPNPFHAETALRYRLDGAVQNVSLTVYDVEGVEAFTAHDLAQSAGEHTYRFNGSALPAGTYYYVVDADGFRVDGMMTIVK